MMPTDRLFPKVAATMRDSQPMIANKLELSPCAVSVLGQLFVEGPTSDNNITNKAGRCDLVSAGLAFHEAGLSWPGIGTCVRCMRAAIGAGTRRCERTRVLKAQRSATRNQAPPSGRIDRR